jgi:hypothetical protein
MIILVIVALIVMGVLDFAIWRTSLHDFIVDNFTFISHDEVLFSSLTVLTWEAVSLRYVLTSNTAVTTIYHQLLIFSHMSARETCITINNNACIIAGLLLPRII